MTAPLARRFARHLARAEWPRAGEPVIVALSGGLDSVALLHLCRFTPGLPFGALAAAHFDHRMRRDSAADAAWVRGLCRAWDVPLRIGAADTPPRSEAEARAMRYAFLEDVSDGARILTAHHADDQAETVLLRLIRGTGLRGLAGIRETRGRIARPLLPFRRRELEAYARTVGLTWREDPTNIELRYARNRIRHEVLPLLESVRPGAVRALARTARLAAEQESVWESVADELVGRVVTRRSEGEIELARDTLRAYPSGIRARVLRRVLDDVGSRPGRAGTRAALEFISSAESGARIDLPGGALLERSFDRLLVRRSVGAAPEPDRPVRITGPEAGCGVATIGGRRWAVSWGPEPPGADGERCAFDASLLRFPLVVRGWRPGDRIALGYGRKKLKKLFAERRLARGERSRIPVLAEERDRVLWIPGIARSTEPGPGPDGPALHITVSDERHG